MTLFSRLKSAIAADWTAFTRHEFVARLGDGSLPLATFQDYLVQDYRFLIHFARAYALAAYKSRDLASVRHSSDGLRVILGETSMHVGFAARWGVTQSELESASEKLGTVAYTRYVLDTGLAGDLLELNVALAPCVIGYAEIGKDLEPELGRIVNHPYREWIVEYAGEEFQTAARAAEEHLDSLAGDSISDRRFSQLVDIFATATRLEADFWQQAK